MKLRNIINNLSKPNKNILSPLTFDLVLVLSLLSDVPLLVFKIKQLSLGKCKA